MTTQLQTVKILMPKTSLVICGLEFAPIPPAPVVAPYLRRIGVDGSTTTWYSDGKIEREYPNGLLKTWWAKPSMAEAVQAKPFGSVYQFHSDGSVTSRCCSTVWYWGEPVTGAVEEYEVEKTPVDLYRENSQDRYSFWS